jgi:hypothetical protein
MGASRPFRQAVKCGAATIATGLSKPFLAGFAVLAVVLIAAGASGASFYRPSKEAAIAAALKASQPDGFAGSFPRRPQGHRCLAHPGGPEQGAPEPRTCWTSVRFLHNGDALVTFARRLPYFGKKNIGETWVFRVSRSLRVSLVREPGSLPEGQA